MDSASFVSATSAIFCPLVCLAIPSNLAKILFSSGRNPGLISSLCSTYFSANCCKLGREGLALMTGVRCGMLDDPFPNFWNNSSRCLVLTFSFLRLNNLLFQESDADGFSVSVSGISNEDGSGAEVPLFLDAGEYL